MDCSPPGSSIHGIFQARILERVAVSFSRGSSWPRDRTQVSRISGRCFTVWATREDPILTEAGNKSAREENWGDVYCECLWEGPRLRAPTRCELHGSFACPVSWPHCSFRPAPWAGSSGGVESDVEHALTSNVAWVSVCILVETRLCCVGRDVFRLR